MSKPKPDLSARRADLEEKLASIRDNPEAVELVNQASDAVAAINNQAADLERQIAEIDSTLGARAKKQRDKEATEQAKHLEEQRKQLAADIAERQEGWAEAEKGARMLANGLTRALAANRRAAAGVHLLSGKRFTASAFSEPDVVSRAGGRLSSVMAIIPRYRTRLGAIEWRGGSLYRADQSWADAEAQIIQPYIKPLIGKETTNGKRGDEN